MYIFKPPRQGDYSKLYYSKILEVNMTTITVRKSGGSLIMTIPQVYTEQNEIKAGEELAIEIVGDTLTIKPTKKKKYSLEQLLDETPTGLQRIDDWLEMKPVGNEVWSDSK